MRFDLVVIGTSFGGLQALSVILSRLPRDFPLPIAIVQHRGKGSDETMAQILQEESHLHVREAEDKEPIEPGCAYIAPSDYHLLVEGDVFALSTEAPVAYRRPSIDALFESAADAYGGGVIGVLLTGANDDGTRGLRRIKARGGFVVVQEPATACAPAMPRSAIKSVAVDAIVTLDRIATLLVSLAQGSL